MCQRKRASDAETESFCMEKFPLIREMCQRKRAFDYFVGEICFEEKRDVPEKESAIVHSSAGCELTLKNVLWAESFGFKTRQPAGWLVWLLFALLVSFMSG
ncbi:hypothetical protein DdX_16550 [Ditylenchus destructor]|uniref:Uncharacterized protein n=1 Tax=Ditylenchus destructor TaxID=166010 RepID=A0AAD4QZS2_9BILA|nr:hypothetical protein DdX_16550 [Ditylenchus destructor]